MHRRSGLCMVVRETMREGDEGDDTLRRGHRLVLSDFHYLQRIDRSSEITERAVKYRLPNVTIRASEIGTSHFFSERRFVAGPGGTIRLERLPLILFCQVSSPQGDDKTTAFCIVLFQRRYLT